MKNSVLLPKKESKKKKDHGALALMCLKQVNSFSSAGKSVIWCFWSVCVFWKGLLLRFSFSIPSLSVIPSTLLSLVVEITVTLLRTFRTNINTNTHTKKKHLQRVRNSFSFLSSLATVSKGDSPLVEPERK